ncbi:MAG: ThuA domain-containing protein [Chloroflexi bacterium]|nr:ThuA domain-containing protein [Chloroflexota bacterium]
MNLLVLSGGRHPYEESTPVLEGFLTGAGHEVNVTEDASILADADAMSGYDALVFNTMRAGDDAMTREQQAGMTMEGRASSASTSPAAPRQTGTNTTTSPAAVGCSRIATTRHTASSR